MTNKEKRILDCVDETVNYCLKKGVDKEQIAEWLDDVICDLPEDSSSELFNTLRIKKERLLWTIKKII